MLSTRRYLITLLASLFLAACSTTPAPAPEPFEIEPSPPFQVTILAFNDFHGHIQGPSGTVLVEGEAVPAGGAAYLAAHLEALKAENPNTVVVAAGDLIGATPLISALFDDEPTIEALGMAGLEISAVGNHEFDRGVVELLRKQNGGCSEQRGCTEGRTFEGASFQYLAANVTYKETGETILPAIDIREFNGVKIGFIGLTLEGTPDIVTPSAIETVDFANEVETINALVPKLQQEGIETIVVLIHEGGYPTLPVNDINDCAGISGPILDIAEKVDNAVDVIVTGHTHQAYICEIGGKLVTSGQSSGRVITNISLTIDAQTHDVRERTARQQPVHHDIEPDARLADLVTTYQELSAPLANRPVGKITADILRKANDHGESTMGRLVADAQLAATAAPDLGNAKIAFMNPGGIREALLLASSHNAGKGVVTYAQLYTVQPFGNNLVTVTLTGEQIHQLLEQQWREEGAPATMLQVSKGFSYTWNADKPIGQRVDPKSIKLNGKTIQPDAEYRVTANKFLADGGDGFTIFAEGTDRLLGVVDLDAFVTYFEEKSPIKPPADTRIKKISKK